jgi:hypothetical protein
MVEEVLTDGQVEDGIAEKFKSFVGERVIVITHMEIRTVGKRFVKYSFIPDFILKDICKAAEIDFCRALRLTGADDSP